MAPTRKRMLAAEEARDLADGVKKQKSDADSKKIEEEIAKIYGLVAESAVKGEYKLETAVYYEETKAALRKDRYKVKDSYDSWSDWTTTIITWDKP